MIKHLFDSEFNAVLETLDTSVSHLQGVVAQLAAAVEVPRSEIDSAVEGALTAGRRARELLHSYARRAGRIPSWSDRASLESAARTLLSELEDLAKRASRERMAALARALEQGRVRHRVAAKGRALEALRVHAQEELSRAVDAPEGARVGGLPGPADHGQDWLEWFWSLVEPRWSEVHEELKRHFSHLAQFVFNVEKEWWDATPVDASASAATEPGIVTLHPGGPAPTSVPLEASPPEPTPERPVVLEESVGASAVEAPAERSSDVAEPVTRAPEHSQATGSEATREPPVEAPAPESGSAPEGPGRPEASVPPPSPGSPPGPVAPMPQPPPAWGATSLPDALQSFVQFRQHYWRNPGGRFVTPPWLDSAFQKRLSDGISRALIEGRFSHLWLFAKAAQVLQLDDAPTVEDVEAVANLWSRPALETSGSNEARGGRLAERLMVGPLPSSTATRLQLALEAVRPCAVRLSLRQVDEAISAAGIQDVYLGEVLRGLLKLGAYANSPCDMLRRAVQRAPLESLDQLKATVQASRDHLRDEVKTLWSAAGGRIIRTHCRQAWTEFMITARPLFDMLGGPLAVPDATRRLGRLRADYEDIADRRGAKHEDRKRMDRAAATLFEAAQAVVHAVRRLEAHQREVDSPSSETPVPVDAYHQLMRGSGLEHREEEWLRKLLRRVIEDAHQVAPLELSLTVRDLFDRPSLMEAVPLVSVPEQVGLDAPVVDVRSIKAPVEAAVTLMDDPVGEVPPGASWSTFPRYLRETNRQALLLHIQALPQSEAAVALQALQAEETRLYAQLASERARWRHLSELAHPIATPFERALDEIESQAQIQPPYLAMPEWLIHWLQRLGELGQKALDQGIEQIRLTAQRLPSEQRMALEEALRNNRLTDVLALRAGESRQPVMGVRATFSRADAHSRFPNPAQALARYKGSAEELRNAWREGLGEGEREERLRLAFVNFIGDSFKKRKRDVAIRCKDIRERLAEQRLNPSFVPQLARLREVVVTTPPVPPTNSDFVTQTAEAVARFEHCITVVLVPRLTAEVRDQLLHEFRRRPTLAASVFDDLDLCRLLNPGGQQPNLTLGLVEIMFEQQRWKAFSPFETQEGQHTKMEMYVGRSDEAGKLISSASYSRLFSGRKLGKSALLKHVHDTQNGKKLPSGLTLRVLYVPAVGIDSEVGIVDQIEDVMRADLQFAPRSRDVAPAARLSQLMSQYLTDRPTESLLIFLDEADSFVEEQIRAYDERREQCLTWQMRTNIEARKDKMDLPRVRFVFAGYRVTHKAEGAWANWGDVLRLNPLAPDEAVALIAGPLARLGIDASHEAGAIAYRCGYQPAVLIRFGQQLIEHLEAVTPAARREAAVVLPEHVATVFSSQTVQQEIRTVVWNNFQGNRLGRIVFSALLLEFAELAPGGVVDDAPPRVLQRINQIVPGFEGFPSGEGAALDIISRHLRDFVGRSLLIESDSTTSSFLLKFPHHLPVLLQEDQVTAIRSEVRALEVGASRAEETRVRSLLGSAVLEDLRYALEATAHEGMEFTAIVVCSHWPLAIEHPTGGVADRLGFERERVLDSTAVNPFSQINERRLALAAASEDLTARVVHARRRGLPPPLLLGGADLLRWGLRQRNEDHERLFEIATVGRLEGPQLQWWFERVRGVEFSGRSPIGRFLEQTSGIPFLVGLLDSILFDRVGVDGVNVSDHELSEVDALYGKSFAKMVKPLQQGPPTVRLLPREIEILRILCRASRDADAEDRAAFVEAVTEGWSILYGSEVPLKAITMEDLGHLSVLQRLGLLRLRPDLKADLPFEHLAPIPRGDALFRIVEALGA